ncbi:MAG: multifunctional CCA addition/repair protein [Gammaproteobacteria bacterium]|nr:multifunctional CCA addition/repair protein [Gammaproteobacteria bacterium]
MEIYLVGGAVRDRCLGLPVREKDWVVTQATPEEMLRLGYRQVGRDFPVFIHAETGEEYALARTEKKTAPGYKGFTVHASPEVTLEQDLQRRDLTINAMAVDSRGELIDPCGGRKDLEKKKLRHISPAFREDPVRLLRVARFAARFADSGFTVAEETMELMRGMVADGEADALVAERIWQETHTALLEPRPQVFFQILRDCGALPVLFPELEALFGVPQNPKWHPEIDCGVHMMMALQLAARLSDDPVVRFAVLVHDLGKGTTPKDDLPRHIGHEKRSVDLILEMGARLRIPNEYLGLARLVAQWHGHCHRAMELRPATLLKLIEATDAWRRPQRLENFLTACEADYRGRGGFTERDYPQAGLVRDMAKLSGGIAAESLDLDGLKGDEIGARLSAARCRAIAAALKKEDAGPA